MKDGIFGEGFGREDAPMELRVPVAERAIGRLRPVGDALAKSGGEAAGAVGRQAQALARGSNALLRSKPLVTAGTALALGAVLGALLSPRRWKR